MITLLTKKYPGMRAWLTQRLTGLVMAIYVLVALVRFFMIAPDGYEAWLDFFKPAWWRVMSLIFWLALSLHAWLGMRDVLKDYVPNYRLQMTLQKALGFLIWVYLVWAVCLLI